MRAVHRFFFGRLNGQDSNEGELSDGTGGAGEEEPDWDPEDWTDGMFPHAGSHQEWDVRDHDRERAHAMREALADRISRAAQMAGCMPGDAQMTLKRIRQPKFDFGAVLGSFASAFSRGGSADLSIPNRRTMPLGMWTAGFRGKHFDRCMFAVDTSYSVTGGGSSRIEKTMGIVRACVGEKRDFSGWILQFDASVQSCEPFVGAAECEVRTSGIHGMGGTRFAPVFEYIRDNAIYPRLLVVLTDCHNFDKCDLTALEPDFPVVWVSGEGDGVPPPFGINCRIPDEDIRHE